MFPSLKIHINAWSLLDEADLETEVGLRTHLAAVKEAGFQSYSCNPRQPKLKELLAEYGLRYGGIFEASEPAQFAPLITAIMAIDNDPINCQLANHDTSVEKAIALTIALMAEAKKQNASVHLEVHRDTCTETPEKTSAIIEGYKAATGEYPAMNFDFSHPAIVKHILAKDRFSRLLTEKTIPVFQQSNLWHIRPFNAQHCQIPITNGKGNFAPEYEACRPFIRQALACWLEGARPHNEFWVVPEVGTTHEYHLSCFPNAWNDTVALGKDLQMMWRELLSSP